MEREQIRERLYREEGVTLLLLRIETEETLPVASPSAKARMEQTAEGYRSAVLSAAEALFSRLRQAYLADPSPKKHLLTRPTRAEYRLSYITDGTCFSARRVFSLRRSGRTLFSLTEEDRFDLDGYLMRSKRKSR